MNILIKPKRGLRILIRETIESLEVGQKTIFPLHLSESAVRQEACRQGNEKYRYPVSRTSEGFLVTCTKNEQ